MRSLSAKFDHVVTSIEEARDVAKLSLNELIGSLQAHDTRFNMFNDKSEDRVFYMRGESSGGKNYIRGRGRSFRGRGRGVGGSRGGNHVDQRQFNQRQQYSGEFNPRQQFKGAQRQFNRQVGDQKQFIDHRPSKGGLPNV